MRNKSEIIEKEKRRGKGREGQGERYEKRSPQCSTRYSNPEEL